MVIYIRCAISVERKAGMPLAGINVPIINVRCIVRSVESHPTANTIVRNMIVSIVVELLSVNIAVKEDSVKTVAVHPFANIIDKGIIAKTAVEHQYVNIDKKEEAVRFVLQMDIYQLS